MHRNFTGCLLVAVGCGSSVVAVEIPSTEVTLEEPLPPSALTAMGIDETVSGTYTDGLRATRSVSAMVAACVRPMLEREPWLTGNLSFRWDVTKGSVEPGGDLVAKPASSCVASALQRAIVAERATGTIEYELTLRGTFEPPALADGFLLNENVMGLDWSDAAAVVPTEAFEALAGTRDRLRRCAFGALPMMEDELWVVMRVATDGSVKLAPNQDETESSTCIRNVLHRAKFPSGEREYALSVVLAPGSQEGPNASFSVRDGQEFGMIGLLNSGAGGDPDAGGDPNDKEGGTGTRAKGEEGSMGNVNARGNMWGDEIGDSFGAGGLGLSGIGGGGRGEGIGLGTIGVIGHGAGTGTGQGFGSGSGRLGGAHRTKPPSLRMGAMSVSGRLPPEVIQRIVRQNYGRFRLCYENGLRKNPNLAGKVTVGFTIDAAGAVKSLSNSATLPDKSVVSCVQGAFAGLSFPQPEGGVVRVSYPITFSPGDAPPDEPPPPPPPKTLGGKSMDALSLADVEARLERAGMDFKVVPGAKDAGVFVRTGGDVHAVFVGKDESEGLHSMGLCREGAGNRALFVRGPSCEQILRDLLD